MGLDGWVAEREGFEPSIRFCRILTFQASAFDHSATAPHTWELRALSCWRVRRKRLRVLWCNMHVSARSAPAAEPRHRM